MKRNERGFTNERNSNNSNNDGNQKKLKISMDSSHNSEIVSLFAMYSKSLDEDNDRRERLVKSSRDLTIHSKRLITLLHRTIFEDKDEILGQAYQDLDKIHGIISNIIKELDGQEYWKYHKSFTWGCQEYVESISFLYFIECGQLIPVSVILDRIKASLKLESLGSFSISVDDYYLGICDLVGELMRYCTNSVTKQKHQECFQCCEFVRTILTYCKQLKEYRSNDSKMDMVNESVKKIEKICFSIRVRTSEFPNAEFKISESEMEV